MRPDQIDTLVSLSAPTLSPDGEIAVVSASRPRFESDSYSGQLWRIDTAGRAAPRRLTRGQSDTSPRFSPDGALLAFLRTVEGKPQLAVVEADGGEPRILTDAPLGVTGFVWAPNSAAIAFTAAMPQEGRYGTLDGVSPAQESPRRVFGNKWRFNGRGYTKDKPVSVYVLDLPGDEEPWIEPIGRAADGADSSSCAEGGRSAALSGPKARQGIAGSSPDESMRRGTLDPAAIAQDDGVRPAPLGGAEGIPEAHRVTPGDADAADPVFSPDGAWIYFTAALHETADDDLRSNVYRVPSAGGGEPELVAPTSGNDRLITPFFVGDTLHARAYDLSASGLDFVGKIFGIVAIDGDGTTRRLTPEQTDEFGSHEMYRADGADGSALLPRRARGGDSLVRVSPDGEIADALPHGERILLGADERNGTLAVTFSDPNTPGEVAVVKNGELITITNFAESVPEPARQIEFTATSADGYPVHGWVYLPDGDGPHPTLLNIHGGPHADYSWGYFDEPQVYAEAGYAVVQCNPRGSQGYGYEHGRAVKERMGSVDMQDVLAFLEGAVAEFDEIDGDRLGILGGSYGGYLTAWTIAHDHRFAAAIVERGYLDPMSFIGVSDIGWYFSEEYVGRDPEHALTQSPQAVAHQVTTPTLVMHSEEDWRCPPDQAQRYFATLRRAGVETEMLLFPGENHELSRSGTPWHRRERFEAMLEWFGRYLPVERN